MNKQNPKPKTKSVCPVPERKTHGSSLAILISHAWWPLHYTKPKETVKLRNEPNYSFYKTVPWNQIPK